MNWDDIFQAYQQSGQSQAAFCRQRKLSYANFNKRLNQYRASQQSNSPQNQAHYVTLHPNPETEKHILIRYNDHIELRVSTEQLSQVLDILSQGERNVTA